MQIRDLMRTKIREEAEDRDKADEDEDKKNDWKLAAAVIDRMLFIIFTAMFFGGTIVFFVSFAVIHHH